MLMPPQPRPDAAIGRHHAEENRDAQLRVAMDFGPWNFLSTTLASTASTGLLKNPGQLREHFIETPSNKALTPTDQHLACSQVC